MITRELLPDYLELRLITGLPLSRGTSSMQIKNDAYTWPSEWLPVIQVILVLLGSPATGTGLGIAVNRPPLLRECTHSAFAREGKQFTAIVCFQL